MWGIRSIAKYFKPEPPPPPPPPPPPKQKPEVKAGLNAKAAEQKQEGLGIRNKLERKISSKPLPSGFVGLSPDSAKDVAGKAKDVVGDVAGKVKDVGGDVLGFAADAAKPVLQPLGRALDEVRNRALDTLDRGLGISDKTNNLGVGGSYSLGGSASFPLYRVVNGSVEEGIKVERTKEKVYTVSSEINGAVGVGLSREKGRAELGASATVGLGGKAEFEFDNAEDARKAALILAGAEAALPLSAAGPGGKVLAAALQPRPSDISFLKDNISAIEITPGSVSAEANAKFDAGFGEGDAAAGAKLSSSYRLEFKDGKPFEMVRKTEFSGKAGANAAFNLINNKKLGNQVGNEFKAALKSGGEVKDTITVETRIQLDAAKISGVAAFIASPVTAAFAGEATAKIERSVEVAEVAGGANGVQAKFALLELSGKEARGVQAKFALSGLSGKKARQVVGDLLRGDRIEGVGVKPSGSFNTFTDRSANLSIDRDGINIEGRSEERDVTKTRRY